MMCPASPVRIASVDYENANLKADFFNRDEFRIKCMKKADYYVKFVFTIHWYPVLLSL